MCALLPVPHHSHHSVTEHFPTHYLPYKMFYFQWLKKKKKKSWVKGKTLTTISQFAQRKNKYSLQHKNTHFLLSQAYSLHLFFPSLHHSVV